MIRQLCDLCGEPADKTSQRFVDLFSKEHVGIEAITLLSEDRSPTCFLCEECWPKVLLSAVFTFKDAQIVAKLHNDLGDAERYHASGTDLGEEKTKIVAERAVLKKRETDAAARVKAAEKQAESATERVKIVETQLRNQQNDFDARLKREVAAHIQALEDDPEYAKRVARSEARRSAGLR